MLRLALFFLVVSLIAALFGFGGISAAAADIARILFFVTSVVFLVLLVLGLGARFAALALLFMTLVVELTVPDGWPIHITWAAMALAIMAYGAGRLSLDHLLERVFGPSRSH